MLLLSVCATIQYVPGASDGPPAIGSVFQPVTASVSALSASSAPGLPEAFCAYSAMRMCEFSPTAPAYAERLVSVPAVESVPVDPFRKPLSEESLVPTDDVSPKFNVVAIGVLVAVGVALGAPIVVFVAVGVVVAVFVDVGTGVFVGVGIGPVEIVPYMLKALPDSLYQAPVTGGNDPKANGVQPK